MDTVFQKKRIVNNQALVRNRADAADTVKCISIDNHEVSLRKGDLFCTVLDISRPVGAMEDLYIFVPVDSPGGAYMRKKWVKYKR